MLFLFKSLLTSSGSFIEDDNTELFRLQVFFYLKFFNHNTMDCQNQFVNIKTTVITVCFIITSTKAYDCMNVVCLCPSRAGCRSWGTIVL